MALLTPNKMTQQEIEKLAMKKIRELADKEYSIHEAKMGSLFVASSFKNPADKIKWDFTEGFIAGAKSQSMSEWVSVDDELMPSLEKKTQIICADGEQYIGYYNGADNKGGYCWFCDNNDYHYPTHWRNLPPPPQTSK